MLPRPPTPRRAALPLLALFPLAACGAGSDGDVRPPSVLIVSLDTLRADHVSSYGYGVATTPRLDRFAARATRFTDAVATAPWTVPSHASMMTGLFPSQHGAITADVELPPGAHPSQIDNAQPLAPRFTTLAEVLRDEGFATAGFVANTTYLRPHFGISQGFDSWVVAEPWLRREASPAWSPWPTARAIAWVEEHLARHPDQPFLLFLNYFDTHRPYNVSPESARASFDAIEALYTRVMVEGQDPEPQRTTTVALFDRALSTLDGSLGELFDRLEELGLFEDMLVIVTSDHGEYFGEHGLVEHSKDVYQEALHVPLIVKWPRQTEGRVDGRRASLVDIPRIVVDTLPADRAARHAGTFPYVLGEHPVWAENHFSRPRDVFHETLGERFRRRRLAVFEGSFKFIYSSDGAHELYDLASDPAEAHDLAAERPGQVKAFTARAREILEQARAISAGARARELDPEEAAELEAMGYGGAREDD